MLKEYVEDGGTLILGCRAGLKNIHGQMVMLPQPGLLQELTGTFVDEFTFVHPDEETDPDTPVFNDVLTPVIGGALRGDADAPDESANTEVLALFQHSFYAGEPCLTVKAVGKGRVFHLGSAFSQGDAAADL